MTTDREDRLVRPTIVLVHGAFAGSASWDPVIERLLRAEYRVVAAANPLRGLASDAAAVSDLVRSIEGPVVLAAHSYGGAVISNVDADAGEIVGLVFVNGFARTPASTASSSQACSRAAPSARRR
jgi:pimeloyl-ACP methyl ester carboxylesterase